MIFDVGMHKGEDTAYYLRKGYMVVGFEADPHLVQTCRARFKDEIAERRLVIVEGAIAPPELESRITFYRSSLSVWGTIDPSWNERNSAAAKSESILVDRVDIDECLEKFGMPFYMKIDVEGVDTYILNRLNRTSKNLPRYISIESNKVEMEDLLKELRLLKALGYRQFKAVQQKIIPGTRIDTTDVHGQPFSYVFPMHSSGPFGDDIAQPWLSLDEVISEYRGIFRRYRLFGDMSVLRRAVGPRALNGLGRILGVPLPGWFDTHASLY